MKTWAIYNDDVKVSINFEDINKCLEVGKTLGFILSYSKKTDKLNAWWTMPEGFSIESKGS